MSSHKKNHAIFSKIVARAWAEDSFKKKLLENPTQTLKEAGMHIPEGQVITMLENTKEVQYLVLPKKGDDSPDLLASGGESYDHLCYDS